MDTHSYKGWLVSDKLWKRALAVVLYNLFGQLLMGVMFFTLVLILALLGSVLGIRN
ncbi:hypothetical protein KBD09_00745 [Candidatus Woesebacteria bacterium]|nr:hypothetical protein [Candidatus Woesebacteria bacterium]